MIIDEVRTKRHHENQKKIIPQSEKFFTIFQNKLENGYAEVVVTNHENKRELFRAVSRRDVLQVIQEGWVIEAHKFRDGSFDLLIMSYIKTNEKKYRPLHVAVHIYENVCIVKTVYDPRSKEKQWRNDYQKRVFWI